MTSQCRFCFPAQPTDKTAVSQALHVVFVIVRLVCVWYKPPTQLQTFLLQSGILLPYIAFFCNARILKALKVCTFFQRQNLRFAGITEPSIKDDDGEGNDNHDDNDGNYEDDDDDGKDRKTCTHKAGVLYRSVLGMLDFSPGSFYSVSSKIWWKIWAQGGWRGFSR